MFPDQEEIEKMRAGSVDALLKLNEEGLFPAPGENAEEFAERLLYQRNAYQKLELDITEQHLPESLNGIQLERAERIPEEILREAEEVTRNLYGFAIHWVPAFFLSKGLGWLWGGCTVSDDLGVSIFIIRKDFARKSKWFIYDRRELLSHELCHVARFPLDDLPYEEHFAYMTSNSILRRYMGNCFQKDRDAVLFLLPVLLLLGIQSTIFMLEWPVPILPFWILALAWPVFLLIRNACQRKRYFRAKSLLESFGIRQTQAMLFRCTGEEIKAIAGLKTAAEWTVYKDNKVKNDLRWQLLEQAYIQVQTPIEGEAL